MKNLIDHDSFHRIEPTAKAQAESQQKILTDQRMAEVAFAREKDAAEQQANASEAPAETGDGKGQSPQGTFKKRKKDVAKKGEPPRNKFFGGQLFDADA